MWADLLNEAQLAAIDSDAPRVLAIAGAGSGKTRMLAAKIARLLVEGHSPQEILAVTFTRKAAAELAQRVQRLADLAGHRGEMPRISTWHSWAVDMLRGHAASIGRTSDFSVYDEDDREALVRAVARAVGAKNPDKGRLSRLSGDAVVITEVEARLRRSNALTFEQIEQMALDLLRNDRRAHREALGAYRYVLVDEYQDTNLAQAAFARHVVGQQLFIVGDPRQAIYEWRGAHPQLISDVAQDADTAVFYLIQNYRCPPQVVQLANAIAGPAHEGMVAMKDAGRVVVVDGPDVGAAVQGAIEAAVIDTGCEHSDIAVLARSWRELELLAPGLTCPHELASPKADPWADPAWRLVARCLRVAANTADDTLALLVAADLWPSHPVDQIRRDALRHRESVSTRMSGWSAAWTRLACLGGDGELGVALALLEDLQVMPDGGMDVDWAQWATVGDFAAWWSSRHLDADYSADDEQAGVLLTTVHGSKGREWPVVIVADPRASTYGDETDEDRRLLYVACTRASNVLYLCSRCRTAPGPWGRGTRANPDPSPLLPGWAT